MTSSMVDASMVPVDVRVDGKLIHVRLRNGHKFAGPVTPYPRLARAAPEARNRCELNGAGHGIYWPNVDEDITAKGLMANAELAHVV